MFVIKESSHVPSIQVFPFKAFKNSLSLYNYIKSAHIIKVQLLHLNSIMQCNKFIISSVNNVFRLDGFKKEMGW